MLYGLDNDYENNLPENKFLKKYKFIDQKLRLIDKKGRLIDSEGRLIDESGRYVDDNGSFVDKFGNKVDADGDYIVEQQPFLDDNGNPIVEETKTDDPIAIQSEPVEAVSSQPQEPAAEPVQS